jgi:hypothetical protein
MISTITHRYNSGYFIIHFGSTLIILREKRGKDVLKQNMVNCTAGLSNFLKSSLFGLTNQH